jgi:hypothetical protein
MDTKNYVTSITGNKYQIAKPQNNDGLKRKIIELVLNLASPDDDCMLSDFLHALQFVINDYLKHISDKHQEELSNYNSFAASDIEHRYELALLDLIEKIKSERDLAKDMIGETAKPVIVAYNSIIQKIQQINVDNY